MLRIWRAHRGLSLVEIAFAAAVLAIIALGYLGSLSSSVGVSVTSRDQTAADLFAAQELELLRAVSFDELPYFQTSTPKDIEEVPDYLTNLVTSVLPPNGNGQVASTGHHPNFPPELAADGIRLDSAQGKWVALENGPFAIAGGGWPGEIDNPNDTVIGGGGTSGGALDPGNVIDPTQPGTDVDEDSQMWWLNFRQVTRMHRILYDNRFNTFGDPALETDPDPVVQKDAVSQYPGIYQRRFKMFASNVDLGLGIPFNPAVHEGRVIYGIGDQTIDSAGIIEIRNDPANPLETVILGIGEIYTVSSSDPSFHYPYVGELEVFGYNTATAYIPTFDRDNGSREVGNYIMFFPKYAGSDYDLARRVYWTPDMTVWPPQDRPNVLRVEIEVMRHDGRRNTKKFMEQDWWQTDNSELTKLASVIYRDAEVAGGTLPQLPTTSLVPFDHTNYRSNEDFLKVITVPGAEAIRLHFSTFDLQRQPDTDFLQIYDVSGNQYGLPQYFGNTTDPESLAGRYSPWLPGDTVVLRFKSDASGSSLPPAYFGGVKVDFVEINGIPEEPTEDAANLDEDVAAMFETQVYPRLPLDRLPEDRQSNDNFFRNPDASTSGDGSYEESSGEQFILDTVLGGN
ncbi:MAG: hypothetical protein GEEBNDBF_01360 [bacterium]|nr:hypothetical protein [bacterium]